MNGKKNKKSRLLMNRFNPLVSAVIITYNSAKYVIETLDSIKAQTYQNIELIVSDDCSTDETTTLVKEWLEKNGNRFVRACLIESPENTGIAPNCNRGYKAAQGEWIKALAGDDLLLPDCIQMNVEFVAQYPEAEIVFSKIVAFSNDNTSIDTYWCQYGAFCLTKKQFLYKLLSYNFIPAATCFIKKSVWQELGGFDENIPLMEDWILWIKAVLANKKMACLNGQTVKYRIHQSAISNGNKVSPKFIESSRLASEYSLQVQKRLNFLLWAKNKVRHNARFKGGIWRHLLRVSNLLNPMTYYLRYIDWLIKKQNNRFS